jgi:tetratricopeptide (TPR) repeat protein
VACAALLAGCKDAGKRAMVADNGPARLQEAHRLAIEAEKAYNAGNKAKAVQLYRQSLAQSQELVAVWNNLGLILMEDQNYVDAVEMFKAAADLSTRDPKPYYNIALCCFRQGWPEQALQYWVKSLERSPNYLDSLRGAIMAAKLMDIADHPALDRTRRALSMETDPQWRKIEEQQMLRIEGTMTRDAAKLEMASPVAIGSPGRPHGRGAGQEGQGTAPAALPESMAVPPASPPAARPAPAPAAPEQPAPR